MAIKKLQAVKHVLLPFTTNTLHVKLFQNHIQMIWLHHFSNVVN